MKFILSITLENIVYLSPVDILFLLCHHNSSLQPRCHLMHTVDFQWFQCLKFNEAELWWENLEEVEIACVCVRACVTTARTAAHNDTYTLSIQNTGSALHNIMWVWCWNEEKENMASCLVSTVGRLQTTAFFIIVINSPNDYFPWSLWWHLKMSLNWKPDDYRNQRI